MPSASWAGSWSLNRITALGTIGTVAITLGASQPGSPFALKLRGAWFFGLPGPATDVHQGLVLGLLSVYGGMALLAAVWYQLAWALRRRPGFPVRALVPVFALWVLPLLVAPPLFSQDVYSYAALGDMVTHGLSPYHYGTDILGATSYANLVSPVWTTTPTPYGPLFLGLAGLVTGLTAHHELATVVAMRVLELAAVGVIGVIVPKLAVEYGRDPAQAFALAVLNPVTLLALVGGAHNDALTVALLAGGVLMAKRGRPVVGIALCTLAAAIKFPAGLGVVYIGWGWLGPRAGWRERIRPLLTAGLLAGAMMELLARLTRLGWGWLAAVAVPGAVRSMLDPTTGIGTLIGALMRSAGLGLGDQGVLTVTRGTGELAAVVICIALLVRSERLGKTKALALSLLAVVVLGPVIQPWYLVWGVLLLTPVASGWAWGVVIGTSIFATFIPLQYSPLLFSQMGLVGALVTLAGMTLAVLPASPLGEPARQWVARLRAVPTDP